MLYSFPCPFFSPFLYKPSKIKSMENRSFETLVHYLYWDNGRYMIKLRKNVDKVQTKKLIMSSEKTFQGLKKLNFKKHILNE